MIPLIDAIEGGLWLRAECAEDEDEDEEVNIKYQIKISGFRKIDIKKEVDDLFELQTLDINSNVWLMELDFVNLCKSEIPSDTLRDSLVIEDEEGFTYATSDNTHLIWGSNFANSSGLYNFFLEDLPPKVKRSGAIAYELPEFYEQLFLKVMYGEILAI